MRGPGSGRARLGRPFWLVWTASTASALGDGIRYVAFPLLAAGLTRDPEAVAVVSAAGFLPWPLFGLLGGALVDRMDRRRLMWRTDLLRAVLVGGFAVLVVARSAPVAVLAAVAFVLGAAETLFDNAASAILPMLVPPASLERANSWLFTTQMVMSTLIGAPVGGALFGLADALPIVTDAATFVAAAALVACLAGGYSARIVAPRTTVRQDIVAGLRWLWRERLLRTLCLLLAAMNATFAAAEAVLVLYALDVLRVNTVGYSLLLAIVAVGGVLGGFLAPAVRRAFGLRRTVGVAALGQAAALVLVGFTSQLAVTVPVLAVVGATGMVWSTVTVSLRQTIVPPELLGRVTSAYRVVGLGAMPLGAGAAGLLARVYGLHAPYLVGSALLAVCTLVCLPFVHDPAPGRSSGD